MTFLGGYLTWLTWFSFGLGSVVFLLWFKDIRRWKGKPGWCEGLAYEHRGFFEDRGWFEYLWWFENVGGHVYLGIDMPSRVNCQFRHENSFDRWAKSMRLITEQQTGHPAFDDLVFFESDSTPVKKLVSSNSALIHQVLSLMTKTISGVEFLKLTCRRGRLWVEFSTTDGRLTDDQCEDLIHKCVPALHNIAAEFNRYAAYTVHLWNDPGYWKAFAFTTLSVFWACIGLLQWEDWHTYVFGQILPNTALETHAGLLTVIGTLVLFVVASMAMGRSSRTHFVLLGIVPTSLFGLYITSLVLLHKLNTLDDPGATRTVIAEVADRHMFFWREGNWLNWNASYLLKIKATEQMPGMDLRVPVKLYRRAQPGQQVQITLHPGKLGYPWVSNPQLLDN